MSKERTNNALRAAQMAGIGLSQLLIMAYQENDELRAEVKELQAWKNSITSAQPKQENASA